MPERVCVIVPCFNEAKNIVAVIDDLSASVPEGEFREIVVVNDCSTDSTSAVLKTDGRATVLDLPCNLGVGGAVQTGFRYAVDNGFEYAVKFDGDGQHCGESIVKLLAPLKTGEADLVVGSRFVDKTGDGFRSTFMRRGGIRFFSWLIRLLSDYSPSDPTSGLRGYNRRAMEFAAHHYPAFDYPEPEELLIMRRNGFRILDLQVAMRERQGGISSISFYRSIYYMFKVGFAILMVAMRPGVRPAAAHVSDAASKVIDR